MTRRLLELEEVGTVPATNLLALMSSRTPLSQRLILPVLFVSLGLAVFARAQAPPGGPQGVPPPRPKLRSFTGADGRWAWLKVLDAQSDLFVGSPSGAPRLRAKGSGWTDVALDGSTLWLLGRSGTGGTLWQLSLEGDTAPVEVLRLRDQPGALLAQGGQLFWLELVQAVDPGLAFVPPLGARVRLQCREANGTVRTLLDRPAVEGADPAAGDLIALANGQLYLRLRSASGTELVSVPVRGGPATQIAGESGSQEAVLQAGTLYWTTPSGEAMPESGIRALRRLPLGGTPETVADWLPARGSLLVGDEGLRYADNGKLYRLPNRLDAPTFVRRYTDVPVASDGHVLVLLDAEQPRLLSTDPAGP